MERLFVPLKVKHVDLDKDGNVVGDSTKTYKLRVNTRTQRMIKDIEGIKPLELLLNPINNINKVGNVDEANIMEMMSQLPDIEYYTTLLYYALQQLHSEEFKTKENVGNLMDEYHMNDGEPLNLINTLIEVYQVSGLFPNASAQEVKPQDK